MRKPALGFNLLFIFLLLSGFFVSPKAHAATLSNLSDTITTSRPSASAVLFVDQAASTQSAMIIDNGSIYLSSDSATFRQDTGETIDANKNVASMSASIGSSPTRRVVYFTSTVTNAHHKGDPVVVPISALHSIQFTTVTAIPVSGKITINFPTLAAGDANNTASPSATTFQMNGLASGGIIVTKNGSDITANTTRVVNNPSSGTAPFITITLDASTSVSAGDIVRVFLGCTAGTTSCSAQSPTIINPTKTAATGTADSWLLTITTTDSTAAVLDTGKARIATIESVQVLAQVEPTLTFTIAGVANATAVNVNNTTGCTETETTNTGIAATSTVVDLGSLNNTPGTTDSKIGNISAQTLTVTTNAVNGYSLTATSSGNLLNPATGFFINSSTTPATFPSGAPWFGIHACGLDVNTTTWAAANCNSYITGSTAPICKYGWPTQATSVTLASDSTGPIGNTIATGNGITSVAYAAGVDVTVPQGQYRTAITYVATPTF